MGFSKFESFFFYCLLLSATYCQIDSDDDDVSCILDDDGNTGVCVIHFLCDANRSVITDGATLIKLRTQNIKTLLNPDEAVSESVRPTISKKSQESCESHIHTCCKPPNGTKEETQHESGDDKDVGDSSDKDIGGPSRAGNVPKPETSGACVFPPYPRHGTYQAFKLPNARPGQSRDSFVLTVSCRRGFGVVLPGGGGGAGTQQVYCINGEWHQEMPKCVRFCKLDPHPSVNYVCHIEGAGFRTCQKYVAPGTLVQPVCNGPIYYSAERLPHMKCTSGFWDYVAKCKAECGRVTPEGTQLLIDGTPAKRGELPWHAGIYRKIITPKISYLQICGGSLITNNVVVSAAHCFWTDVKKIINSSEFAVAIGKLHRQWDSEEDVGVQKSDIKEIKIPNLFQGEAANFQEDIAVLILSTPFVYKTYVRPVCLNFDANFDKWQLRQDNLGKVAGWGLTAANGLASQILKVVELPFINVDVCIMTLPPSFREYITGDKFCAGYTNGTALCQGDSGGGLSFPGKELGIDRYYLRGIVSAAPSSDGKLCNDQVYTTFTKISKHQDFINEALTSSEAKTCPLYSFTCDDGTCVEPGADCNGIQECPDGSDESDELCVAV